MLICLLSAGCVMAPEEECTDENGIPEKEGYILDFSTEFNDGKLDT